MPASLVYNAKQFTLYSLVEF